MATVVQYTASGEEHGLVNTLSNSVVNNDFKHMDPKTKAKLQKEKEEDAQLKKVRYINMRGPHERLSKPYCKYAGDSILMYHLIPNQVYELPYGMVKEVNEVKVPKRSGLVSVDGKDIRRDGSPLDSDTKGESIHMLVPAEF
jgi:hypothetical protein